MQSRSFGIAVLALVIPAVALASGQHPSASAADHPATSAHATAVAAHADAERIEACTQASHAFLDQLAKGDFKSATANFDATLAAGLDTGKLAGVWQAIGAKYGMLESRGAPQTVMFDNMPVVMTPLQFAKGELAAQIACGADGKIAGFHLKPVSVATPAPASSPR